MNSNTYRWPIVFAVISAVSALIAFFVPSLVASAVIGGVAAVFFALALLSLPTAIGQDSPDESADESMPTTVGSSN